MRFPSGYDINIQTDRESLDGANCLKFGGWISRYWADYVKLLSSLLVSRFFGEKTKKLLILPPPPLWL